MEGAINFFRTWRDLCKTQDNCRECPAHEFCIPFDFFQIDRLTDKNITELVRTVSAWRERARKEMPFFEEPEETE